MDKEVVWNIPTGKYRSREYMKIFKEVQRIQGEIRNIKKRLVTEDSNAQKIVFEASSSFLKGVSWFINM